MQKEEAILEEIQALLTLLEAIEEESSAFKKLSEVIIDARTYTGGIEFTTALISYMEKIFSADIMKEIDYFIYDSKEKIVDINGDTYILYTQEDFLIYLKTISDVINFQRVEKEDSEVAYKELLETVGKQEEKIASALYAIMGREAPKNAMRNYTSLIQDMLPR